MPIQTLELNEGPAQVSVVPSRGAIVTRFGFPDDELLYLDPATLEDSTKNIRGGIPLLFPIAGKPPTGSSLKQHGFARDLPWTVLEASAGQVRCELRDTEATREHFAHAFRLEQTVSLADGRLQLHWSIHNAGDRPMPLQFGLHPYFQVPLSSKAAVRIETEATLAFDQVAGSTGPVPPLDFSAAGLDVHLLDHPRPGTILHRGKERPIALEWSANFTTVVLWTQPERPFVCVEPWSSPARTLGLKLLAARATERFSFSMRRL
jgi:galactose mutarotase-like enzyme